MSPTEEFIFSLPSSQGFESSLLAFVFLFNKKEKTIGSSEGMERTVQTSDLLMHRVVKVVPDHVQKIKTAIVSGDFQSFAEITMKESNSLHSVCLDSFPPLFYLNFLSFELIDFVHELNQKSQEAIAAYTFDAGPNGIILIQKKNAEFFIRNLLELEKFDFRFIFKKSTFSFNEKLTTLLEGKSENSSEEKVEVIISEVGDGPRIC